MYVQATDVHLLKGWQAGWSGWSWFTRDNHGKEWQAFVIEDGDKLMSFMPTDSRISTYLTYEEFEEFFA